MQAGRLRQRIRIEKKTVTRNAVGEEVIAWAPLVSLWASIEPLRGREYLEAKQVQASVDARIVVRYQPEILPSMRVVFSERVYAIESVIHVAEGKRETQLMVTEQING
jgi:SPP1 family predicted phage head-tail adaptor